MMGPYEKQKMHLKIITKSPIMLVMWTKKALMSFQMTNTFLFSDFSHSLYFYLLHFVYFTLHGNDIVLTAANIVPFLLMFGKQDELFSFVCVNKPLDD